MTLLYLVGTNHLDLKGPERLRKFLDFVRPDVIGVESTEEKATMRLADHQRITQDIKQTGALLRMMYGKDEFEKLGKYLTMVGYEMWVPDQFRQDNPNTSVLWLDETLEESYHNSVTKEVFDDKVDAQGQFNEKMLQEIMDMDFDDYQRRTDKSYDDHSLAKFWRENPEHFERLLVGRDKVVEPRIREAHQGTEHTMVYIGGSIHFFTDYHPNLFKRLADLNPTRVNLNQVDDF
jgi:hypothetical protein